MEIKATLYQLKEVLLFIRFYRLCSINWLLDGFWDHLPFIKSSTVCALCSINVPRQFLLHIRSYVGINLVFSGSTNILKNHSTKPREVIKELPGVIYFGDGEVRSWRHLEL